MRLSRTLAHSLLLLLLLSGGAVAQQTKTPAVPEPQPCKMTLNQAPVLRGFKLGMSQAEIEPAGLSGPWQDEGLGFSQALLIGRQLEGAKGENVHHIILQALDKKITSIEVTYDGSIKWSNAREFATAVYNGLMPVTVSVPLGVRSSGPYYMDCGGFALDVDYGSGIIPRVHLYDPSAYQVVEQRKAGRENKKRQTFKP